MNRGKRHGAAGYTLIEVIVTAGVASIAISSAFQFAALEIRTYKGRSDQTPAESLVVVLEKARARFIENERKIVEKYGSCPACYSNGDCAADAPQRASAFTTDFGDLLGATACQPLDQQSPAEFQCSTTVVRRIGQFGSSRIKCAVKCRRKELRGQVAAGSCVLPSSLLPDPKLVECLQKARSKAVALIDEACEPPLGAKPACYQSQNGQGWTDSMTAVVDAHVADAFCEAG